MLLSASAFPRPGAAHHSGQIAHPTYQLSRLNQGAQPFASPSVVGNTPSQIRKFYGIDQINFGGIVGDGAGQTIAIVDAFHDPTASRDLAAFDAQFNLPAPPTFQQLDQFGGSNLPGTDTPGTTSWELEESLDVQWAHAIAPAASIALVECNSPSLPDLFQGATTAAGLPNVVCVSMSFGGGETPDETSNDGTFVTPANHGGVTFLAATGDAGSPGTYPAYSPNVVAVGGTAITFGPGGGYGSEAGWSGSGGGNSQYEPRPAYQNNLTNRSSHRSIPDVSMDASPSTGVAVFDSYDFGSTTPWIRVGGTSLATPMWAGLVAIADQGRATQGMASLDGATQTLPQLYALPAADFHDITSGSNGAFTAGAGYDRVTGIGSPVANVLVNDLAGVAAAPPAPVVVAHRFFYNNSAYDGNDAGANANDVAAIDPQKQALLPGGGLATFANYTSYSKGINGIILDVSNLTGTPAAADFTFMVGNSPDLTTWTAAPAPSAVVVLPAVGTTPPRVDITWPDHSIQNEWLQVTMLVDNATGLAAPDVSYFGNLVAESGKAAVNNQFVVSSLDELAARNDPHGFFSPAPITDAQDYNRDRKVDITDQVIARYNAGHALYDLSVAAPSVAVAATAPAALPVTGGSPPKSTPAPPAPSAPVPTTPPDHHVPNPPAAPPRHKLPRLTIQPIARPPVRRVHFVDAL